MTETDRDERREMRAVRTEDNGSDTVQVLELRGELDRGHTFEVRHKFSNVLMALRLPGPLVLDLSGVTFIDAWGENLVCGVLQPGPIRLWHCAWVLDPERDTVFEGVRLALQEFGSDAFEHKDLLQAKEHIVRIR